MKNILIFLFMIGLFAFSCAPKETAPPKTQTEFVQAADVGPSVAIIKTVDETAVPAQDLPAPVKWVDENLFTAILGFVLLLYEFLALKIPTSKTVSIIGNLYKILTFFFPDKNKTGGKHTIDAT